MRCEVCQGARYTDGCTPCAECNGFAIVHCCDGLREQPEETAKLAKVSNAARLKAR